MKQLMMEAISACGCMLLFLVFFALPLFAEATASSSSAPTPIVSDYSLPYPGLLPDSPLYVFKAIRDKMVSFFITDPKSKASFDLLQADKRLAAGFALSKERPMDGQLVAQTISKGENYFSLAFGEAAIAHQQGTEINGLLDQLTNASQKHLQVIAGIEHVLSGKDREELVGDAQRVANFPSQVNKLRPH
jgi:hypothetical protein